MGAFFARAAFLEGASIAAFRVLRDDLTRFGAPHRLVRAAGRATRDERRHYRVTRALARRYGGAAEPIVDVGALPTRELVDVAIENAREGCVRETFGALVAMWQARHARDAEVRTALRRIARDELEHAELAWKVHGFFVQRLSGAERARVESALREEALAIVGGRAAAVGRAVMEVSGVPSPEQTARLARAWAGNVVATLRRRERASSTSQFSTATAAPASHAHPAPELART